MYDNRRNIFNWNHISEKLTPREVEELKAYYKTYHMKCWAYKQAKKHYRKLKLIGNSFSQ